MLDKLFERYGVKYEDLKREERETYLSWLEALEKNQLSIDKIRGYIQAMRSTVEQELATAKLGTKDDMFLKARLRNYLLLEAMMSTPEKARQQIERAIASFADRVRA
jgi:hypothetical protein